MSLQDAGVWANIVLAAATSVGLGLSIYLSIRSMRELKRDKRDRQRPILLFEPVGERVWIEEGKKPIWPHSHYGVLKNYGSGPGLDVSVTWFVEHVIIGEEAFAIDASKRQERRYSPELNTQLTVPGHLAPADHASIAMFPHFVMTDIEAHMTCASGWVEIKYKDIFGDPHISKQGFWVGTGYDAERPYIQITFMDENKRGTECTDKFCQGCSGTGTIKVQRT